MVANDRTLPEPVAGAGEGLVLRGRTERLPLSERGISTRNRREYLAYFPKSRNLVYYT